MKISDIVNNLNSIKELHGDVEVFRAGYDGEMQHISNVELMIKYTYSEDKTEKEVKVRL